MSFGQTEYKRDATGAVKESEFAKMDVYHGVKEVEVGSAHEAFTMRGPKPGEPDLKGAWTFTINGKGAPRGTPRAYGDLPPFQERDTTWRVHVYVTREGDVHYWVEFGLPPNIDSLIHCAMGGPG